jgi:hypothetical protein
MKAALLVLCLCASCSAYHNVAVQPPPIPGQPPPPVTYVRVAKHPPKAKTYPVADQRVMELRHPKLGNRVICYRYAEGKMIPNWHTTTKGEGKVVIYFLE